MICTLNFSVVISAVKGTIKTNAPSAQMECLMALSSFQMGMVQLVDRCLPLPQRIRMVLGNVIPGYNQYSGYAVQAERYRMKMPWMEWQLMVLVASVITRL